MYTFADFDTVKALPDVMAAKDFAKAIGLSVTRTYEILDEAKIPYLQLTKRKVIFKEHLLQGLSGNKVFTDISKLGSIAALPKVFPPSRLVDALGISNGYAYTLSHTPGFPAVIQRNRIIVNKEGLIRWIKENECNRN